MRHIVDLEGLDNLEINGSIHGFFGERANGHRHILTVETTVGDSQRLVARIFSHRLEDWIDIGKGKSLLELESGHASRGVQSGIS